MNKMKVLVLVPIGGLANRYYAISSAISFCQDHSICLRVIWFKDWGMGADFHSLFKLDPSIKNVEVIDARWKEYVYDRPRKRNLWLPYLYQKFRFGKRIYENQIDSDFAGESLLSLFSSSDSIYMALCFSFYRNGMTFRYLSPVERIQERIEKRIATFHANRVLGLHIRRTDNKGSILYSPLSLFIEKMKEEIRRDPNTSFYVASDSLSEKRKLLDLFGGHVKTEMNETRRDNQEGIEDALVELYTLAHTEKIYGSVASSFSTLASDFSSIRIEILSIN